MPGINGGESLTVGFGHHTVLSAADKVVEAVKSGESATDALHAMGITLNDLGVTGEEKNGYYLNEETAKLAQEMFEDEDMRSLFDMKRNMPPERFKAHIEFMKNIYNPCGRENPRF